MKLNEIAERKAGDLENVQKYTEYNFPLALRIACENLTSLEGCPEKITGWFNCAVNHLTSFEYFPKYINNYCYIYDNKFTSFKDIDQHIEYIGGNLYASDMNITSGYSDLFGIDGLRYIDIDNKEIENIINKYLPTKDLINFQDEMIKAGFESYL